MLSSHLAVTQHHGLELEALGAQQVDGLLVLVGEPQRLIVPPEPITDQYSVNQPITDQCLSRCLT